jgi:hypothetical protein
MKRQILSTGCAALMLYVLAPAYASPPLDKPPAALSQLTVAVIGDGTVTSSPAGIACPGTCSAKFARGISVTLTTSPAESGTFLTFTGDCAGTQPSCDVHVAHAMMVHAYFDSVPEGTAVVEPTDAEPAPVPQADDGAAVLQTGQTDCYVSTFELLENSRRDCLGTGQDGELRTGAESPDPRFTDEANGTVRDNLTGLVWLKDAECFEYTRWPSALAQSNALASGQCGLTDGSQPGDWRLPNIKEFLSLLSYQAPDPAGPVVALASGHPFNISSAAAGFGYWTSTTVARNLMTHNAYMVTPDHGLVYPYNKLNNLFYVWPVRD